MILRHRTPYMAHRFIALDKDGAETLVVMLKATFAIDEAGALTVARPQRPIQFVDEYRGEPGVSSLRAANEALPPKPGTDLLVVGDARAPREGVRRLDVTLRVGSHQKTVRVFGPRRWRRFLGWWWTTRPEPFSRVTLSWENAAGGTDATPANPKNHAWDPCNPVGRGFRARGSRIRWNGAPVPNLEDPREPLRRPGLPSKPSCFAPIPPHWSPRSELAGTYDERWKKERVPLLPEDFDERFYHCAPPDLATAEPLRGDEKVLLEGCSRKKPIAFRLPGERYGASAHLTRRFEELDMPLETLLVDADARQLVLVWKGAARIHGEVPLLRRIEIQREGANETPFPDDEAEPETQSPTPTDDESEIAAEIRDPRTD